MVARQSEVATVYKHTSGSAGHQSYSILTASLIIINMIPCIQ